MAEIRLHVLRATFEGTFKRAVLLREAECDQFARKCLEAFASYGLQPTQIVLRKKDSLFNYELSFSLFAGNGVFKISAEKVHLEFKNVTSKADMDVVADCVVKLFEQVSFAEIESTTINANAHTAMSSEEAFQNYLLRFANPKIGIVSGGTIANVRCSSWPTEIRILVERSLSYTNSLFLSWMTSCQGFQVSRDGLNNLAKGIVETLAKVDLFIIKETS